MAVDPTVIPLGTKVKIDNQIYVAEDIGGAVKGDVIDVWVETKNKNFGRKYKEVFIYE
ncbi:3D domain-containing protein [Coprobacillus cateniformis]|uniref:3D domain-containing protein n=1 Tax=Coprobacillus cateniformis TaxID=100884 RepID=UPI003461BE24